MSEEKLVINNDVPEIVRRMCVPSPPGPDTRTVIIRVDGSREHPVYDGDFGLLSEPPKSGDTVVQKMGDYNVTYVHSSIWGDDPPRLSALYNHAKPEKYQVP